ncbi:MAG: peptidylprolyl isomerase [Nitrospina sp.]|jgi:FKBP-type peptidyl-prolyl cis-trans isomerase SlyD|nr:peptidylprolyl isomerase [Nitrospina sp.]MBT6717681.1 peptidylprolyl isomerase [Nitrospina sp.]
MIKKHSVVSLSYYLKNSNGQELDKADKDQPFAYLHGMGQMVPGLEKELEGLKVGDKKDVTVSPAEGYGELNPQLKIQVDRANFPKDADIQPGMQFEGQGDGGTRTVFTVKAVVGDKVEVDGNHPLAGETLHFAIEVTGVRDATQEELTHGHAHGEGGAHNH